MIPMLEGLALGAWAAVILMYSATERHHVPSGYALLILLVVPPMFLLWRATWRRAREVWRLLRED